MKKFSIILALDNENGIGKCNDMAWSIPEDLKYFKKITTETTDSSKKNAVIMGRKTWESIPEKFKPFSSRKNYILSRNYNDGDIHQSGSLLFSSLEKCLKNIETDDSVEQIFIIGGAELYNHALTHPDLEKAYVTQIYDKFHCDVFFSGIPTDEFKRIFQSDIKNFEGLEYEFLVYKRKNKFQKLFSFFK